MCLSMYDYIFATIPNTYMDESLARQIRSRASSPTMYILQARSDSKAALSERLLPDTAARDSVPLYMTQWLSYDINF